MEVFIVRPFGKKKIYKKRSWCNWFGTHSVDFDRTENELIQTALSNLNLDGGTTGRVFEAGSIRSDMFSFLLMADIVIADITIHIANAFYELGIRHALRPNKTILIKSPGFDETSFDILGYRYVSYDVRQPKKALDNLIIAIKSTILSVNSDSPVFDILPTLPPVDPNNLAIVPSDFEVECNQYIITNQRTKLALLSEEVQGFFWKIPALRQIA